MKKFLQYLWIFCGIIFISLIIYTGIQLYQISTDIRKVTSQMTIEDMRQFMGIIETQQQIELAEKQGQVKE